MGRCPRCGGAADRLHPLPHGALPDGAAESGGEPVACRWCLHEVTEG